MDLRYVLHISIHAPTRGATYFLMSFKTCSSNFNPRSYKRSDKDGFYIPAFCCEISIHAPTRGATFNGMFYGDRSLISIHAPTRGATYIVFCLVRHLQFQSTLLQEERHNIYILLALTTYFNPRSYKRSDVSRSILPRHTENFNPRSYKRSDHGGN